MNADTKAVARELVAWFTSGNGVPMDLRYTVKINGDRIMEDVERLNKALANENVCD